jgi:hypothetical protein
MQENKTYLREAGTFDVTIVKTEVRTSKKGNPMLVVTFQDPSGRLIDDYFVNNEFGLKDLSKMKAAIGVADTAKAAEFSQKKLRIVVGFQDPNKTGGKIFTEVKEFLPPFSEEAAWDVEPPSTDEDLPF